MNFFWIFAKTKSFDVLFKTNTKQAGEMQVSIILQLDCFFQLTAIASYNYQIIIPDKASKASGVYQN